ncbi:MAG: sugar phosphate isomerase/epimerase [Caldilineaceae bacterium]|nr:sugar phosphate isomerase/epimerase [Caldilineaceae bacterium]
MHSHQLSVHLMVWSGRITADEMALFPLISELGYNGVELPIFDPEALDLPAIRQACLNSGLACTASTAMAPGLSLIDDERRTQGVAWLQDVVRAASTLGADLLCGPMAVPVGELRGRGFTSQEFDNCVRSLQEVGAVAAAEGVTLALEPLNRFETFMLNTVQDGVRLMNAVDQPSVGLLLDTFHMHIEEKSTPDAIRRAARHIKHFHCSENDRGAVGSGQVDWTGTFQALADVQYSGWLVVESFNAVIPELAGATCIWRPLAESPYALAKESLSFLNSRKNA